jgi:preprotein translocase subunit YajC
VALIHSAWATDAAAASTNAAYDYSLLFMIAVFFVVFYFMILRPQSKRIKEQRNFQNSLQKGDEVITQGGTLGKVTRVDDHYVGLEVASNVVIQVQKHAIVSAVPKGTVRSHS